MRETISRYAICAVFALSLAVQPAHTASKPHILSFGKWRPVRIFNPGQEANAVETKVRPLYLDGNLKEFTAGEPHAITEKMFVIRKAFRINDSLPSDTAPRWVWRLGEWLLADRVSGKITVLRLPGFDSFYSDVSWYQDYAAYCGLSGAGGTLDAVIVRVGTRRPLLQKELGTAGRGQAPDSDCSVPLWERQPARVTFRPKRSPSVTFTVVGSSVELADENPH